ncbi:MAG: GNAT family N-acetyltransferase [Armatimonadetes bacterium]|nr:GNAT family N-acetyltransferase [Armatimonadota bacterium]
MIELTIIGRDGSACAGDGPVTDAPAEVLEAFRNMYEQVGYTPPWVGYVAREAGNSVGTCAFKGPPADGRVEIAYFTFPQYEGRGVATRMASTLVNIAREADPTLTITARTLPEQNASTRVLSKLGFMLAGTVEDPEDGSVWEWVLQNGG